MNRITTALHEATHRIPGIPEHDDARAAGRHQAAHHGLAGRGHGPHPHPHRRNHQHGEPRILVGWQNRIAAFVAGLRR